MYYSVIIFLKINTTVNNCKNNAARAALPKAACKISRRAALAALFLLSEFYFCVKLKIRTICPPLMKSAKRGWKN